MRCRAPRYRRALLPGVLLTSIVCVSAKAQAPAAPTINAGGAVNAASYATAAPLAPGSIVAVFGDFLPGAPSQASGLPLPTDLSGLSVQFGSVKAPLFYASTGQVNLQVPWELAAEATSPLAASLDAQTGAAQTVQFAPFSPGIFTMNAQGTGQGAILDSVFNRLVDGANPALPGTTILQIFCTGLGAVSNQPPSGSPAPASPSFAETTTTPTVTIGELPAKVLFSGLAPDYVGLYQVNAVVPAAVPAGSTVPVVISIGGVTSNTATIAAQGLSPSFAPAGSGPITLTVYGTGFTDMSSVTFNGIQQAVTFVSGTQLTVALSAAELAIAGTYGVVVTTPGGGSMSKNFTVYSSVLSLGGHSVNIDASATIGTQVLPSVIGVLATGDNTYSVAMNDLSALPAYPQFQAGFSSPPVSTGSSVSFNSTILEVSPAGVYQPDPGTASGSMASASLTITFTALAPGAPVSGTFSFGTAQGTVNGNFTGIIISVD